MRRRTWSTIFITGTLGAVFGLAVLALAAGRVFGSGIQSVPVLNEPARATFVVEQAAAYVLILVAGAAAGAVLALVAYAAARLADPDVERFPAGTLATVGAITGAVLGFAVSRAAIGVGGTITPEGLISLSVFRAAMVALITGAAIGAVIGGSVERLSRPETLRLEGPAWPEQPAAFMRDAVTAMGIPTLGLVLGLAVVYGFSYFLLEADHTTSLIAFGAAAALVLFGAAAIAAMPPRRGRSGDGSEG